MKGRAKVKHHVIPKCKYGCTFLQITDGLWLCEHASFGEASYLKGAVEEARILVARAGGLQALVAKQNKEKEDKKLAKKAKAEKEKNRVEVRYG